MKQYNIKKNHTATIIIFSICYILCMAKLNTFAMNNTVQRTMSLDDCINAALKNHPRLIKAKTNLVQSQEKLNEANSGFLPQIDVTLSYDRLSYVSQQKKQYLGNSKNDYQAGIFLNQPLFTGGKIFSERKMAKIGIELAKIKITEENLSVIYEVKKAFFNLLHKMELNKSSRNLLRYAEAFYKESAALHSRTKMPRLDTLLQIKIQRDAAKIEKLRAETEIEIAKKELLHAMGLPAQQTISIRSIEQKDHSRIELHDTIENNPEILQIKKIILTVKEEINQKKAGYFPQVAARGGYKYECGEIPPNSEADYSQQGEALLAASRGKIPDNYNTGGSSSPGEWYIGLVVSMPVGSIVKTRAEVKGLQAYLKGIVAEEKLVQKTITLKIESAHLKYTSAQESHEMSLLNLKNAKKSLELMRIRHRRATVSNLELLEAQRVYARAEADYAGVVLELRLAAAEMDYLTGIIYDHK